MQRTMLIHRGAVLVFLFFAVVVGLAIGNLKISYFNAWRYTSDLFTYDTVIQETARGHFGLEFTYGNTFGDHAYLILIILTPFKFILQTKMVYLLLLAGPLVYLVSSISLFLAVRKLAGLQLAWLTGTIYLLGFSFITAGLIEKTYGMHPDTFSGFLIVAITALLIWRDRNIETGEKTKHQSIVVVIFLLLFLLLKEEMVLLAICFFVIVSIMKTSVFTNWLTILSGIFLVVDAIVIQRSQSTFNRGNQSLISGLFFRIKNDGIDAFLFNPLGNTQQIYIFWLVILLTTVIMLVAIRLSTQKSPYVIGLFSIGFVKFLASLFVYDYNLTSWHNFPALVMLSAAILLQFLFMDRIRKNYVELALKLLFLISVFCFLWFDLTFINAQLAYNARRMVRITTYHNELMKIKNLVDPERVVAIPPYTVKTWGGYRYSFFPRGVSWSPVGIADYIVYPLGEASVQVGAYEDRLSLEETQRLFSVISETSHFVLLERTHFSEEERTSRSLFFQEFGLSTGR